MTEGDCDSLQKGVRTSIYSAPPFNSADLPEFIHLWADVPIAETDDVAKLLAQRESSFHCFSSNDHITDTLLEDLSNSSVVPEAPKVVLGPAAKKKKKSNRVLKITNTHMKALVCAISIFGSLLSHLLERSDETPMWGFLC